MLKNKNVIVTGCNKGIGKSILEVFARNNANIFACARSNNTEFAENIDKLKKKYNINIFPIFFDLNNEKEIAEGFEKIRNYNININVLVNNAASIHNSIFEMSSLKKFKEIFEINFFSQIKIIQHSLKMMKKIKNSSIINISSTSAEDNNFGRSIYSSSKASLESLTKSLCNELSEYKIRVNAIAPGLTKTDMMTDNTPKEIIELIEKKCPLKRLANPDEIANVALFLASDLSSYVNGQIIRVDGGIKYSDRV